jgi:hypothetical protein
MDTVVCVGGGVIGSQAATEARQRGDHALVIDSDEHCPAAQIADRKASEADEILEAGGGEVLFLPGDGITVLDDLMLRWTPERVVPGTPGHLAARLAVARTKGELVPFADALADLERALPPNTVQLVDREHAVIVASFMPPGGTCIERCPRPPVCPVTGRSLPEPMHVVVSTALAGTVNHAIVLVTAGTGIGSIAGKDLQAALWTVDRLSEGETLGIATSCTCHAVINLLQLHRQ